ncbi:MAG: S-adenosyl-L-methionine-dependent methyltransferase [Monoraphidium minutum]|nr:MAG: S-adenosyl-L-methionine-dependent methyltransferase [Monoraphidium minutum]
MDTAAQISLTTWNSDVYEPSDDSFALVDALLEQLPTILREHTPRIVVEVGCGSGYVITSAARALRAAAAAAAGAPAGGAAGGPARGGGCSFVAVDVSGPALAATARTLAAHEVAGVDLVRSDLLTPLSRRLQGCVDLLLFNPPYVPTPDDELLRPGIARAWAGGHRGRLVIDRLLPLLPALLAPGGSCLMVTVLENEPEGIISEMAALGLAGSVVLQRFADEECLKIVRLQKPAAG